MFMSSQKVVSHFLFPESRGSYAVQIVKIYVLDFKDK